MNFQATKLPGKKINKCVRYYFIGIIKIIKLKIKFKNLHFVVTKIIFYYQSLVGLVVIAVKLGRKDYS
jgi:hypothetical protein